MLPLLVKMEKLQDSKKQQLENNITKCYLQRILGWSFLYIPTFILYLEHHGLSLREVLILKSLLCVFNLILEVPSGYFADLFGRRFSLILGSCFLFVAMGVYLLGTSFSDFVIAEALIAIGWSFISGADSALLYDSLIALGREDQYHKIESRMTASSSFSEALGGLIAGILSALSLSYPYFAQIFLYTLLIGISFSLTEPPRRKIIEKKDRLNAFIGALRFAAYQNKQVQWIIIFNAINGSATFAIVWLSQGFMNHIDMPVFYFGFVWMVLHFWLGGVSYFSHSLTQKVGRKTSFMGLALLVPISYWLLAYLISPWGLSLFLVLYFVRGVRVPLIKDELNERIESDIRATIISISRLGTSFLFAILSPVLAWITSNYGIQAALYSTGWIYLLLGLIAALGLRRNEVI